MSRTMNPSPPLSHEAYHVLWGFWDRTRAERSSHAPKCRCHLCKVEKCLHEALNELDEHQASGCTCQRFAEALGDVERRGGL